MMMERSEGSVVLAFCAALVVAVGAAVVGRPRAAERPAAEPRVVRQQSAEGLRHAVAAAAPEASDAGLRVLEEGGNAADALVTASFVMAVVRPQSTGIGGGGFVLYHDARTRTQTALDGRERAPAAASEAMYLDSRGRPTRESLDGPRAAAVPGLVAMLWELYQRHGSGAAGGPVSWSRLVQPAIELAEEGFPVPPSLARAIARRKEVLERYPAARDLFMPKGRPLQAGDILRQPGLGRTLRAIAREGRAGFYEGPVAAELAFKTRAAGGLLSTEDLAAYEVVERQPLRTTYRRREVVSMPPPSSGGVALIQMLNLLGTWEEGLGQVRWHSPDHLHILAETMKRAYADRAEHLGDPDFVSVPVARLTGTPYALELRRGLAMDRAMPARELRAGLPAGPLEREHTTHISVVDARGSAASSTQTVNTDLGSGFIAGDTGVLLNNEMDDFAAKPGEPNAYGLVQGRQNAIQPGKRPLSSMTPTFVLHEGRPILVLGSPGGPRIINTVLQVLSNVVDFDMPLDRAVAAPRIHHQWLPDELLVEPGVSPATVSALGARGHVVRVLEGRAMGDVQAIQVRPSGARVAVSDPRGEGRPSSR
ncbi:MAG: gamma-glutamyltransferase [Planctomycetes bacterium]|nr:gamma-glutamyltransferase [Planctomycetota bacterium]